MFQSQMYWYNFKTKEYDFRETPTGEEMKDYLPNEPAAHGLYDCHIALGKSPLESAAEVLTACLGLENKETP